MKIINFLKYLWASQEKSISIKLKPFQVLFLDYIEGLPINGYTLPKYWHYEYNLNANREIKRFKNLGYIKESSYKFNITQCKVSELKDILRKYNLKVSGNKSQLIERIIKEIPEEDCKRIFNKNYYQHTNEAKKIIEENQHIIYAHKNRSYLDISIDEVDRIKKRKPNLNTCEVFLHILDKRAKKYSITNDWGLYRNALHSKSLVYNDMKRYEEELKLLCEICYRDLSGLSNSETIDDITICTLAPGILKKLIKTKEKLNMNDNEFEKFYFNVISHINLSFHYFSDELTWDILQAEINEDPELLDKLYKKARRTKKNNYKYAPKFEKKEEAEFMAPQWLKQVNESAKLVNNTKNPDTFFFRYKFMIEKVNDLIDIQKYLSFKGDKPIDMLKQINDKKIDTINDFIDRYYNNIVEQINKLKTDKAKQKRIDKFYSSLVPYFDQMEKENIDKINELDLKLKNKSNLALKSSTNLIKKDNKIDISNLKWYIMISFGKSTSKSYNKAVYLAKNSPKYDEIIDEDENITHTATYTSSKKDFLDFIVLYDLVSSWKSTFFIINGELVDKKTVGKIKYCYGDKCRSVKTDFCYGASYMTANPFGCHRLQISQCNNPWWEYYVQRGNHYSLDRDKLIERIELTKETFKYCPSFDIENIMNVAMSFPLILKKGEYKKIIREESNLFL